MNREKILNAITYAIDHLENSMKLLSNKKQEETSNMVWQAASDVEYCLFLLSLFRSEEVESLPFALTRKHASSSKQKELQPALSSTLDMLKEAKHSVQNGDLAEAHEKTWKARSYLFNTQKNLEKKHEIGAERSSTTPS